MGCHTLILFGKRASQDHEREKRWGIKDPIVAKL
jgi:hypothetical protein